MMFYLTYDVQASSSIEAQSCIEEIYDANIIESNDTLALRYYDGENNYLYNLEGITLYTKDNQNYNYYVDKYDLSYNQILQINMKYNQKNNAYFIDILIINADSKINRIYLLKALDILYNFEIINYSNNNFILQCLNDNKNYIDYVVNNFYSLMTLSETDSRTYVVAQRDDYMCRHDISTYSLSYTDYMNSNVAVQDDDIVNFIPREYFFTVCENVFYSDNYGFYIKTSMLDSNKYSSKVSVFKINIDVLSYLRENQVNTLNLYNTDIRFIPIFSYTYYGILKTNFNEIMYNFGTKENFVERYKDFDLVYGYSDFIVDHTINNVYELNYGNQYYNENNERGSSIEEVEFELINDDYTLVPSLRTKQIEYGADIMETALGYVNFKNPVGSFAYTTALNVLSYINEQNMEYHNMQYSGSNIERVFDFVDSNGNGDLIKTFYYLFEIYDEPMQKDYILHNNLRVNNALNPDDFTVMLKTIIQYRNIDSSNGCLQQSNTQLYLSLYDLGNYGSNISTKVADIMFNEISTFQVSNVSSSMKNVSVSSTGINETYYSAIEGFKTITLVNTIPVYIDIYNQNNSLIKSIIASVTTTSQPNIFIIWMDSEHQYTIKMRTSSNYTQTNISYGINNSSIAEVPYSNSMNFNIMAKDSLLIKINVSSQAFYVFETVSTGDPELTMVQNGVIISENDDTYEMDEEGNEEYSAEASVSGSVNNGYLYIIIKNKSNYSINLNLNSYHF